MIELSELNDFVKKLNDEITIRVCDNLKTLNFKSSEFTSAIAYFHNKQMTLETTGHYPVIKYAGIIVWDAKVDSDTLDFDDLLRSRLDFISNVLYNMDFMGSSKLYCKNENESEFYLT